MSIPSLRYEQCYLGRPRMLEPLVQIQAWLAPYLSSPARLVVMILLANTVISLLTAIPARRLIPVGLRGRPVIDYATLTAMGTLIPLLGPILLLLMLIILPNFEKDHTPENPYHLSTPTFAPEIKSVPGHFGVGGAVIRLRRLDPGSTQSTCALLAIDVRHNATTTRLLRETLSHPDENLRLLAHALIDRRETGISRMIQCLENAIPHSQSPVQTVLHLELAELHQELLYMGLVREGMSEFHLRASRRHLNAVRGRLGDNSRLLRIEARILQQSGQRSAAVALYERALAAGAPPARVLPYLADFAWQRRDYPAIRQLFSCSTLFSELPVVGRIASRWRTVK